MNDKTKKHMSDETKVILIKASIVVTGLLELIWFVLMTTSEKGMYGDKSQKVHDLCLPLFGVVTLSGVIMSLLMTRLKFDSYRTKSSKYKIKTNDYTKITKYFCDKFKENGYEEFKKYSCDSYEVNYSLKREKNCTHVVGILKFDELDEKIYLDYDEARFESFGNYLIEKEKINVRKDINVIYIICVNKVTKYFSKYTESNVEQELRRYHLPVGISFASKTLYVATQEDGFAKGKYKKIKKEFMGYVEDLIVEQNDIESE